MPSRARSGPASGGQDVIGSPGPGHEVEAGPDPSDEGVHLRAHLGVVGVDDQLFEHGHDALAGPVHPDADRTHHERRLARFQRHGGRQCRHRERKDVGIGQYLGRLPPAKPSIRRVIESGDERELDAMLVEGQSGFTDMIRGAMARKK